MWQVALDHFATHLAAQTKNAKALNREHIHYSPWVVTKLLLYQSLTVDLLDAIVCEVHARQWRRVMIFGTKLSKIEATDDPQTVPATNNPRLRVDEVNRPHPLIALLDAD